MTAFANRVVFVSEGRVSHSEHAMRFRITGLSGNQFGRFGSGAGKGSPGRRLIAPHQSDYAFAPGPWKRNSLLVTPIDRQSGQGAKRGIEIALIQRSTKPKLRDIFGFARIFGDDRLYCRDQRARVGMPLELDLRTRSSQCCIFGSKRDRAVHGACFVGITAQKIITRGDLLENSGVLRVELYSTLETFGRFRPSPLPSIDIAG